MSGFNPVILLFLIFVHFFLLCFHGFNIFYYLIYNIGLLYKLLLPLSWDEIHVIENLYYW